MKLKNKKQLQPADYMQDWEYEVADMNLLEDCVKQLIIERKC